MLNSINHSLKLYVIQHGDHFTCLGFEVAFERATKYAEWLKSEGVSVNPPNPKVIGTSQGYEEYTYLVGRVHTHYCNSKKKCPVELTQQLVGLEGKRVEVIDRYGDKRRFIVGKSTGFIPVHLEIATKRSTGGGAVTGAPFASIKVIR